MWDHTHILYMKVKKKQWRKLFKLSYRQIIITIIGRATSLYSVYIYWYLISIVQLSSSNGNIFIPGGRNPVYSCASLSGTTITSVEWLINGTQLEDLGLTNVVTGLTELTKQEVLVFNNISVEYNNTNIQCRATLSNRETVDSNNDTLLVQGERAKVHGGNEKLQCIYCWLL